MISAITAEAAGSDQIKSFFVLKVRDGTQGLTERLGYTQA